MKPTLLCFFLFPLLIFSQPQYEWAYGLGGPGDDYVADMITDEAGNVYLTGSFRDFLRYDTTLIATAAHDTATNLREDDAFVMKLSPSGRLLWARSFGEYGYDTGIALALSPGGALYWGGGFSLSIQLDSFSLNMADSIPYLGYTPADNFIAKVDSATGDLLSVRHIGAKGRDHLQWLGVDHEENLWVGGTSSSKDLDLGGTIIDEARLYFAKYSPLDSLLQVVEGVLWNSYRYSNNNLIQSVDISEQGNIQISFTTVDSLSLGGQLICTQGCHLWLKLDSEGQLVFWKDITEFPGKVAVGPNESTFLAGYFDKILQIDSLTIDGGSWRNLYSMRFDSLGKLIWIDNWPTSSFSSALVNEVVYQGNKLYWTGDWKYPLILTNGDTLISAGLFDGVLVRYDLSGNLEWAKQVGGNSDNFLSQLAISAKGEIYTVGSFYSYFTLADTIIIANTFGGLDRFEYWIGKMQDSLPTTSAIAPIPASAIKVYPNPFEDHLSIQGLPAGQWEFRLVNAQGQKVFHSLESIHHASTLIRLALPLSLSGGVYGLYITSSSGYNYSILLSHP